MRIKAYLHSPKTLGMNSFSHAFKETWDEGKDHLLLGLGELWVAFWFVLGIVTLPITYPACYLYATYKYTKYKQSGAMDEKEDFEEDV